MTDRSDEAITVDDMSALSPSECRVLDQALHGFTVREIADRLVLTEATVKTHLTHIYAKLGVRGRVDLLARFREAGPPRIGDESARTPSGPPRPSRFPPRSVPPMAVSAVALLVLLVAALIAIAGGPRSMSLASVVEAIEAGRVSELRLDGDVLTAVLASGEQYRVTGVVREDLSAVATENRVAFGISPKSAPDTNLLYAFNVAGYVLVVGVLWLWLSSWRNRRLVVQ